MDSKFKTVFTIALVYTAILLSAYNAFLVMEHEVHIAGDNMEVAVVRRHDLLGNAVAAVTEYRDIEKKIFEYASEKRGKIGSVNETDEGLTALLLRLSVLYERYPGIKTVGPHKFLMSIILDSGARVTEARSEYNRKVVKYNLYMKTFPRKIYAGFLGFHEKNFFSADEAACKVPDLNDLKVIKGI